MGMKKTEMAVRRDVLKELLEIAVATKKWCFTRRMPGWRFFPFLNLFYQ